MRSALTITVCALALTGEVAARQNPTIDPASLDQTIVAAAAPFNVPGFAIAIVKDGKPLLVRGYGVLRANAPTPVDEHTLFYLASATKAFTVAGIGILADEGKLRIDQPLVQYLPEFALADPAVARAITVRDALSHRTGVPRADLFLLSGLSQAEVLRRMSALAPAVPIRSRFGYSNQMYLAAGMLIEKLTGQSWQSFIESRLLRPIGFTDGNAGGLGHWPSAARPATPHTRPAGPGTPAQPFETIPRAASGAGGINASASDMSQWLLFNLGDGTSGGTHIVGANVLAAMQAPNVLVIPNLTTPDAVLASYGLGWFIQDYRGRKIVQHGGNGEGWTALMLMSPADKFGVAVLTNVHGSAMPYAMAFTVMDRVLGSGTKDWAGTYGGLEPRMVPPPLPQAPADLLPVAAEDAGRYEHPLYGTATLSRANGRLVFTYGELSGEIDGLSVKWMRPDMLAVLGAARLSARRDATDVRLLLEAGGERYEFTRHR